MNLALKPTMSLDAFLEWEATQELRFEFDGHRPVAMVGGTNRHERIVGNLYLLLRNALKGKPCQPTTSNVQLRLAHSIRYPDLMVIRQPVAMEEVGVTEATVIVEVTSPGTARTDRIDKLEEYRAISSLAHYVMVEQETVGATLISRSGELWAVTIVKAGGTLTLPSIDVSVAMADIYDGVFDGTGA